MQDNYKIRLSNKVKRDIFFYCRSNLECIVIRGGVGIGLKYLKNQLFNFLNQIGVSYWA